jgi:hypothetical protein
VGAEQGVFQVDDPDFLANHLYAQGLGAMHLARVAAGVRELAPGVPQMFPVDPKDVMRTAIDTTFAYVLAPSRNGHHSASSKASAARVEASSPDAQD